MATLLVFSFAALLWLLITQTVADADLWGHLRFGLDLLSTHRLPQWDSYSFTADRMWVNHEWLSEAAMAVAYRAAGPLGLNLLKLTAIGVIAAIVVRVGRRERAAPIDCILLAALVVLATYTRTQVIRPQLFSVPVFCLILYAISEAERQRYRALMAVPFCFALWVNLHGAWIIGLACWGFWLAAATWTTPERRGMLIGLGAATLAATLVNPYGPGLWRFLGETVRLQRLDISDWKPLLQLPPGIIMLNLILPAVAACAIVQGRRRVPLAHLGIVAILAAGMWRIGRADAFLQAAIGILFAPQILAWFAAMRARAQSRVWQWTAPLGRAVLGAGAVAALTAGFVNLRTIELQGAWLPDASGLESVRQSCAGRKVLTWFDWGEYAIWHLSADGIRVSIDGRRETIYSQRVLEDHLAFYNNERSAIDYPDRIAAECVWLPARFGTVSALEARGWTVVARTPVSAVLRRSGAAQPTPIVGSTSAARVFPGP
ncbi:MAG TPA: hypothetical protein VH458_07970 [Vicinamibacterales bacterium]|jgi:hypothetical protein